MYMYQWCHKSCDEVTHAGVLTGQTNWPGCCPLFSSLVAALSALHLQRHLPSLRSFLFFFSSSPLFILFFPSSSPCPLFSLFFLCFSLFCPSLCYFDYFLRSFLSSLFTVSSLWKKCTHFGFYMQALFLLVRMNVLLEQAPWEWIHPWFHLKNKLQRSHVFSSWSHCITCWLTLSSGNLSLHQQHSPSTVANMFL